MTIDEALTKHIEKATKKAMQGMINQAYEQGYKEGYEASSESIGIVRCRDCKYQDKGENESDSWNLCGFRPWLYIPTSDDHFCGYGERGDSDDETVDIPEHEVLACDKYGAELLGFLFENDGQWMCECEEGIMYDVVAWMEKPEPYKGDTE